jgi:hypothetical protein
VTLTDEVVESRVWGWVQTLSGVSSAYSFILDYYNNTVYTTHRICFLKVEKITSCELDIKLEHTVNHIQALNMWTIAQFEHYFNCLFRLMLRLQPFF